jgi:hypothetical protein
MANLSVVSELNDPLLPLAASSWSRRASGARMPPVPMGSLIRAPTYSASSSYRMRTSVASDASAASVGRVWRNCVIGIAAAHASSSMRPSITTGALRRVAPATGVPACTETTG